MAFVPVPHVPEEPSPRTKELSRRLTAAIDEYLKEHPGTSPVEIRDALRLAMSGRGGKPQAAVMAVGVGALVAVALGLLLFLRQSGSPATGTSAVAFIIMGIAFLAVLAAAIMKR